MLISHEMFRTLVQPKNPASDESVMILKALVDPGPDLVVRCFFLTNCCCF